MSEQNSLCFPCLEKVRTKFPVFPVPWPPCFNKCMVSNSTCFNLNIMTPTSGSSRISQEGPTPEGGASTYYFAKCLRKNCIKMEEFQPRDASQPQIRHCHCQPFYHSFMRDIQRMVLRMTCILRNYQTMTVNMI